MTHSEWTRPLWDGEWQRRHVWQHLLGGVVWWGLLVLGGIAPWAAVYWTAVIQGGWERFQREYEPTYPVWSMAADTLLAVVGAALVAWIASA